MMPTAQAAPTSSCKRAKAVYSFGNRGEAAFQDEVPVDLNRRDCKASGGSRRELIQLENTQI